MLIFLSISLTSIGKILSAIIIHNTIFYNEPLLIIIDNLMSLLLCLSIFLSIITSFSVYSLCKKKQISFQNLYKSLLATHHIRNFCMKSSDNNFSSESDTKTDKINNSLYTLEILYNDNFAVLIWYLPENHEVQQAVKEMFTSVREELNAFDSNYIFSDISREKRNRYTASATRIK